MPDEQNISSSGGSATQTPETPATGTPSASQGATPQSKPTLTVEELLQRIADLEHSKRNATEEVERHRKKLSSYEKTEKEAEAAKKAAEEAQLSEIDRIKKQHAELQATHDTYTRQMQERIVRYEVERQAAKLGIIDPDAAAKLLDWSELDYDEDGTPTNAEKLLEKLLKARPYLAPPAPAQTPKAAETAQQAQQQQQGQGTPALPAMNPGRTNIQQPGSPPPGKVPSLQEAYQQMARQRNTSR